MLAPSSSAPNGHAATCLTGRVAVLAPTLHCQRWHPSQMKHRDLGGPRVGTQGQVTNSRIQMHLRVGMPPLSAIMPAFFPPRGHPSFPLTLLLRGGGDLKQGHSVAEADPPASVSSALGLQACTTRHYLKQTPPSFERHTRLGFEFSQ